MPAIKKPIKIKVENSEVKKVKNPSVRIKKTKLKRKNTAKVNSASSKSRATSKKGKIAASAKEKNKIVAKEIIKKNVAKENIESESKSEKYKYEPKEKVLRKKIDIVINKDDAPADSVFTKLNSEVKQELGTKKSETTEESLSNKNALLQKENGAIKDLVDSSYEEEQDKETEEEISDQVRPRRSIKLYRKIAFSFIFLTICLVAVIFYFAFIKVTIVLIPNQERVSNNMIIDICDKEKNNDLSENAIKGVVKLIKIEHENIYSANGEEVIGQEAVGRVKIINSYTKNQPLVATTRLLTPGNKLFRIKRTVNVPAGGSVEVEIYADEPSKDMAVGPTKFTIPGLWAGLQNKIYAESSENIVYKQKIKKYIIQADIDNSISDLKQQLLTKAKSEINKIYQDYGQIIYKIDENSINSEVIGKIGEEKDEFITKMEAEVIVVAFNDQAAARLAKQKFVSFLSDNKELITFDENNIIYSLNNYNYPEGMATINATFEGKVSLKENFNIVEIDKILGLNQQQLDAYLTDLPEIAGYEVKFYPSFRKRVPKMADRVKIEIKK